MIPDTLVLFSTLVETIPITKKPSVNKFKKIIVVVYVRKNKNSYLTIVEVAWNSGSTEYMKC